MNANKEDGKRSKILAHSDTLVVKRIHLSPSEPLSPWESLACCINSLPETGQQAFSLKDQVVNISGFTDPVGLRMQLLNFALVVQKQLGPCVMSVALF